MTLELEPPPGIVLRPAEPDDFSFAGVLYAISTRRLLTALGRWDENAVAERFAAAFRKRPSQVVMLDGKQIGWLQVSRSKTHLHLHQVHLIEAYRNRGIGTHLIRSVMDEAREAGLPLELNVIRGNPAIELYRRLGFEVVGSDEELFRMKWVPVGAVEKAGKP